MESVSSDTTKKSTGATLKKAVPGAPAQKEEVAAAPRKDFSSVTVHQEPPKPHKVEPKEVGPIL